MVAILFCQWHPKTVLFLEIFNKSWMFLLFLQILFSQASKSAFFLPHHLIACFFRHSSWLYWKKHLWRFCFSTGRQELFCCRWWQITKEILACLDFAGRFPSWKKINFDVTFSNNNKYQNDRLKNPISKC